MFFRTTRSRYAQSATELIWLNFYVNNKQVKDVPGEQEVVLTKKFNNEE